MSSQIRIAAFKRSYTQIRTCSGSVSYKAERAAELAGKLFIIGVKELPVRGDAVKAGRHVGRKALYIIAVRTVIQALKQ